MKTGGYVVHVLTRRRRKVLAVSDRRARLEGIGWVGLNPETKVPAGYEVVP
jgi:hypothetical protein